MPSHTTVSLCSIKEEKSNPNILIWFRTFLDNRHFLTRYVVISSYLIIKCEHKWKLCGIISSIDLPSFHNCWLSITFCNHYKPNMPLKVPRDNHFHFSFIQLFIDSPVFDVRCSIAKSTTHKLKVNFLDRDYPRFNLWLSFETVQIFVWSMLPPFLNIKCWMLNAQCVLFVISRSFALNTNFPNMNSVTRIFLSVFNVYLCDDFVFLLHTLTRSFTF